MSNHTKNNLIIGCLCALGCETLFGLSYMFTKSATESASALELLGWRYFIAVVFMSILVAVGALKINLKGKSRKPLIAVALFCPLIYFVCETVGISRTTASESGVLLACIPVASLVASTLILHKKPSRHQVIGIIITLVGVSFTVLAASAETSLSIVGYAALIAAVCSYALYCVFVEKASDYSGAEITYVMLIIGAVVFGIAAIVEALSQGSIESLITLPLAKADFLVAILYQGIGCSAFAFFLSNLAIAKIGVNRTSSFIGVSTVVSILAGVIILGESFTLFQIAGAVVILVGVYVANSK